MLAPWRPAKRAPAGAPCCAGGRMLARSPRASGTLAPATSCSPRAPRPAPRPGNPLPPRARIPRQAERMRRWTLAFAVLTAALTLALALVVRENRRLREQLVSVVEAKARAAGLERGSVLTPFTLRDASGRELQLDFAGGYLGTVLLFHASACGACANTRPFWRSAIEEAARPDVRVLCIQTDVVEGAPLALEGLPASLAVPLPPVGWL